MILYCDTSALIKRYVEEDGSDKVDNLWNKAAQVATSTVAFAESIASVGRKWRERILSEAEFVRTVSEFKNEHSQLILVPITTQLNRIVEDLIMRRPLRGFDAIHLASAILINRATRMVSVFACYDHVLNMAAKEEGFEAPCCD